MTSFKGSKTIQMSSVAANVYGFLNVLLWSHNDLMLGTLTWTKPNNKTFRLRFNKPIESNVSQTGCRQFCIVSGDMIFVASVLNKSR